MWRMSVTASCKISCGWPCASSAAIAPSAASSWPSSGPAGTWQRKDKTDSSVGKPMTRAALSELPTTPDGLRDYLKTVIAKQWGAEYAHVDVNAELYQAGVHIIMDLPAPPNVRAAAFRMLASLPGVKAEGEVTDPLGRTGQTVSLPHGNGEGRLIMRTCADALPKSPACRSLICWPRSASAAEPAVPTCWCEQASLAALHLLV